MRKKIYYIISDIEKALAFEWINDGLDAGKIDLCFILIGKTDTPFITFLRQRKACVHVMPYSGKKDLPRVWWQVFSILFRERPDAVHTHLWLANLVGLSAAWFAGIRRRIFTRHHATIHYREYPSGRKWDRLLNYLATDIIAISESIKEILVAWDKARPEKVHVIHHGFDGRHFQDVTTDRIDRVRHKYNISAGQRPVVGVIARYTQWKGVQYIIPAFQKILTKHPAALLVLANARGDFESEVKTLLAALPNDSYTEIAFEEDLGALYRLFNVYVHVPIDPHAEAFGQTYVEALIAGVPAVFTLSGVAREFICDRQNALVVDFEDSDAIYAAVIETVQNQQEASERVERGKESVQPFGLEAYLRKLHDLYLTQ